MAHSHLPAVRSSDEPEPYKPTALERIIVNHLTAGGNPSALAKKIAKKRGKPEKWRTYRMQIVRAVGRSEWIQQQLHAATMGELIMALPGTAAGVGRMGKRGRTDAAKLNFEATGFHNPKVQHEHSGDVSITLNIPRPAPVVNEDYNGEVVDADVVED